MGDVVREPLALLRLLEHFRLDIRGTGREGANFRIQPVDRPGEPVHLLAQAVLIGYLIRSLPGALACSLGMLVPASLVTILFTAFFVQITTNPIGSAVMSGVPSCAIRWR